MDHMEASAFAVCAVIIVVAGAGLAAQAQDRCSQYVVTLGPCVAYVQNGNNSAVGRDCCEPLGNVVGAHPECVCTLATLSSSVPNINVTRANSLNTLCSITSSTASLASCNSSSTTNTTTGSPTPNGNHGSAAAILVIPFYSKTTLLQPFLFILVALYYQI